ncbi:variant erythrocyte surface antigen beta subunit, putative [Babesia ovis]|uniref:Variant erythrocyte surface antigen beta subunit, putative n=1 Tax=Babesia ovis TaxID=5869 RepID=A0A9W5WVN2_BABOV|nr:variant erythrocyte surface antigen beta subunit, putative [Babesia ovis]
MSEGSVTIRDSLLNSPTNLKEAIDWILRVTNKDGQETLDNTTTGNCLCPLSQAVVTVLRDVRVKDYLDHQEERLLVKDILDKIDTIGGVRTTRNLIEEVAEGLRKFVGWKEDEESSTVDTPAKKIVMGNEGIGGKDYTSAYSEEATISTINSDGTGNDWTTLAKIFLGCIPFVFSGLSYLYWMSARLQSVYDSIDGGDIPLLYYVMRMGYPENQWRIQNNGSVTLDPLVDVFDSSGIFDDVTPSGNYATFLDELRKKAQPVAQEEDIDPGRSENEGNGDFPVQMDDATDTKDHALLKLNTLCTGYFRALNQPYRVHRRQHRLPRTIREILYWLSCVQYCPVFRVLVQKMRDLCERNGEGPNGEITFYGSNYMGEQTTCTIDSSNCITYFLSAALIAPMVLLSIQDTIESLVPEVAVQQAEVDLPSVEGRETPGQKPTNEMTYEQKIDRLASTKDPVPIHDLYANTLFEFRFPMSETQSYYLLQDCLFGLFYQLYFLMKQCYWGRTLGYGWGWCKYGDGVKCDEGGVGGVNGNGKGCTSWICPEAVENGKKYDSKKKNYEDIKQEKCGKNGGGSPGKASPLQAFLCDCLKGFTCPEVVKQESLLSQMATEKDYKNYSECYPEFLEHRGHTKVFGQECAVPMGFTGCFRSKSSGSGTSMIGLGICGVLYNFTIDDISSSSLYQLTRCICSLTRRVPRSTGTLYGFFYGLGGMLSDSSSLSGQDNDQQTIEGTKKVFTRVLDKELRDCPGYRDIGGLMIALYDWRGMTHQECNTQTKTKNNGYHEKGTLDSLHNCETPSATCGKYLKPLSGSMYNSVATVYTDTYLSWILYLSGRLQDGLKALRDEFRNINCKEAGCKGTGGGPCECPGKGCTKGTHGNPECCCPSITDCVGVHPLLYRFGFTFNSPDYVGGKGTATNYKRECYKFYERLKTVIEGPYYTQLTKEIYRFLYTTRLPFSLVIFAFWSIVMVYLLWSMTVNLDILHIQSHWRSPRSYLVPVQKLLADGSRKGFCTLGYFQEYTGDRLLSQGVSDVYL